MELADISTSYPSTSAEYNERINDADDYEEMFMVLTLNGVIDAEAVQKAAEKSSIRVRMHETEKPIVQIGSSLYSGEWTQTLGTDLIFCSRQSPMKTRWPIGGTENESNPQLELLAVSDTRLEATKALLSTESADVDMDTVGVDSNTEANNLWLYRTQQDSTNGAEQIETSEFLEASEQLMQQTAADDSLLEDDEGDETELSITDL